MREVFGLKDRNGLVSVPDRDNLIGSAMINEKSNIVLSDEIIYLFLGASYAFPFVDYLHEDCKEEFLRNMKDATYDPVTFNVKLKHYDGKYPDVSVVMKRRRMGDEEYINIDLYDIEYMSREYLAYLTSDKVIESITKQSGERFFRYDVTSGQMCVYDGSGCLFKGSMDLYRATRFEQGCIEPESMPQFRQLCAAIESANGDGFFKLNTTFCNSAAETGFKPTIFRFATIEFNSQVVYVAGFVSDAEKSHGSFGYESVRVDLDPLTGMLNKAASKKAALDALEQAKKDGELVTFVMIDLDNFKTINDTFGHMFGDTTLVNVARIIMDSVGERGIAGRIGGDEFFIVLKGFEDNDAAIRPLLRSIRSHIEWYFKQRIENTKVTCSIGTATYPMDADNYDDLFRLADHCLYVGKALGRDRFIIYREDRLGSIDDILNSSTVIQMSNYVPESDKHEHLRNVIQRFNNEKDIKKALSDTMEEIRSFYDVDTVMYCPFNEKQGIISVGYEVKHPRDIVPLCEAYRSNIDEDGFISIGNYENSKASYPLFADYMSENEFWSIFIAEHKTMDGRLLGVFIFATHKRYQVWSAFDTRMLCILCRVMEAAVL